MKLTFNALNDSLSDYETMMRTERNHLLTASDWTQTADAPVDKTAWAAYRQALRDFPATWEPGPDADFPNPPGYIEPTPTPEEETIEE